MSKALNELKETISVHLEQCDPSYTPYICSCIGNPEGKNKMIDTIAGVVLQRKSTVGDAVLLIESLYNPNILD